MGTTNRAFEELSPTTQRALRLKTLNPVRTRLTISTPVCLFAWSSWYTEKGSMEKFNLQSITQNVRSRRLQSIFFNPWALWELCMSTQSGHPLHFVLRSCRPGTEHKTVNPKHRKIRKKIRIPHPSLGPQNTKKKHTHTQNKSHFFRGGGGGQPHPGRGIFSVRCTTRKPYHLELLQLLLAPSCIVIDALEDSNRTMG